MSQQSSPDTVTAPTYTVTTPSSVWNNWIFKENDTDPAVPSADHHMDVDVGSIFRKLDWCENTRHYRINVSPSGISPTVVEELRGAKDLASAEKILVARADNLFKTFGRPIVNMSRTIAGVVSMEEERALLESGNPVVSEPSFFNNSLAARWSVKALEQWKSSALGCPPTDLRLELYKDYSHQSGRELTFNKSVQAKDGSRYEITVVVAWHEPDLSIPQKLRLPGYTLALDPLNRPFDPSKTTSKTTLKGWIAPSEGYHRDRRSSQILVAEGLAAELVESNSPSVPTGDQLNLLSEIGMEKIARGKHGGNVQLLSSSDDMTEVSVSNRAGEGGGETAARVLQIDWGFSAPVKEE